MSTRAPSNAAERRRIALAPAILLTIALLIGPVLIGLESFTVIRYVVSIFALIIVILGIQARSLLPALPMAAVAVLWNPVVPFELPDDAWRAAHYLAALATVLAGVFIRTRASR